MNEEEIGPPPTIVMLSTDCVLHFFQFFDFAHPDPYPGLVDPSPLAAPGTAFFIKRAVETF